MSEPSEELLRARERWRSARRPRVIVRPGPGQESVWDYPRPPRLEPSHWPVRVEFAGRVVAESEAAWRVCETASPPTYYVPPEAVDAAVLVRSATETVCEWKGAGRHFHLRLDDREARDAAWSYPDPFAGFERIRDYVGFYPGRVDACFLGEQRVEPQPGGYYAGWITPDVTGPFKGGPGSEDW